MASLHPRMLVELLGPFCIAMPVPGSYIWFLSSDRCVATILSSRFGNGMARIDNNGMSMKETSAREGVKRLDREVKVLAFDYKSRLHISSTTYRHLCSTLICVEPSLNAPQTWLHFREALIDNKIKTSLLFPRQGVFRDLGAFRLQLESLQDRSRIQG